jgi:hypothetical protein
MKARFAQSATKVFGIGFVISYLMSLPSVGQPPATCRPTLIRCYPRNFTFHVAPPVRAIRTSKFSLRSWNPQSDTFG